MKGDPRMVEVLRRLDRLERRLKGDGVAIVDLEDLHGYVTVLRQREQLLGKLFGADFNTTNDNAISIEPISLGLVTRYRVRRIVVVGATISLTTAVGGVYTAVSKGGNALVNASQVYIFLTDSSKALDLTLSNEALNAQTVATIYLSLTIAQGAAALADVFVYGDTM